MEWRKGTFLVCKVLGLVLAIKSVTLLYARSSEPNTAMFHGIFAGKIPEEFLTRYDHRV